MFSTKTMPTSTIVPIAIAIPPSAITFASTPRCFISTKVVSTPSGRMIDTSTDERRCGG